jgi:hypothetical protein
MRERGTQCQYTVAAITVVGPSNDHRKPFSWQAGAFGLRRLLTMT